MTDTVDKTPTKRKKRKAGITSVERSRAAVKPVVKAVKKLVKKPAKKLVKKIVKRAVGIGRSSASAEKSAKSAKKAATAVAESWFWVSALYRLTPIGAAVLAPERANLWERRVFVIRAARGEERRVARELAKAHEARHEVAKGEKARWRLQEIEAFAELFDERIENGTEVYWQFFKRE
jgi:hypothetical protein